MASGQRKTERTKGTAGTKRTPDASPSLRSLTSFSSPSEPQGFLPPHGSYQRLLSYQKAQIVYDATVYFCNRFLSKRDRTHDQMVQAARSGKQNIAEGSQASGTSKATELKLTNVARASLEELLIDYRDFLRLRGLREWTLDHPYVCRLRAINRQPGADYNTFRKRIEHPDPAICANVIIGLIKLTNYLLDRQIKRLEEVFLKEGGLRERMTRARLAARAQFGSGP
jgi:four helix bundle suffix protein